MALTINGKSYSLSQKNGVHSSVQNGDENNREKQNSQSLLKDSNFQAVVNIAKLVARQSNENLLSPEVIAFALNVSLINRIIEGFDIDDDTIDIIEKTSHKISLVVPKDLNAIISDKIPLSAELKKLIDENKLSSFESFTDALLEFVCVNFFKNEKDSDPVSKVTDRERSSDHDDSLDVSLRPKSLEDFIGQEQVRKNLSTFIEASKARREPLDHVLFSGPPGLGKTTLAQIIAFELGVNLHTTSGPVLAKAGDLAAILTNLKAGDVLFIDEIHRLNSTVEEILYPAMEDFELDLVIGEGSTARAVKIKLAKFTLVGATTRLGLISKPLRDRFGIPVRLNLYSVDEMTNIVKRGARLFDFAISPDGASAISTRARGTPRIAGRLLRRVIDFAIVAKQKVIDADIASETMVQLGVDEKGLDDFDRRYLSLIAHNFKGGPVGIETITSALDESRDAIEDMVEPFLMQEGFLQRTSRGRVLTAEAFKHLGLEIPHGFLENSSE